MESRRNMHVTRRTLLGGAVAAGAASALAPAESLAAALEPPPGVFSRLGRFPAWHVRRDRGAGALRAGRSAVGRPGASRESSSALGAWAAAGAGGRSRRCAATVPTARRRPTPGSASRSGAGLAEAVQLRSDVAVDGVRLHFVTVRVAGAATAAAGLPLVATGLDAGPGQPPIIGRAAWARGGAPPRFPPAYGAVKLAFVHHSEGPNGYRAGDVPAILKSIYQFHRFVRGYNDIGYNFAIDAFGRIWEARAGGVDEPVIGAHAGGYNFASTGVVILGTFISLLPPAAALAALERLLAWKLSLHGVPVLGHVRVRVDPDGAGFTRFAPERARVPAEGCRPPRRRSDRLPRQRAVRATPVDPSARRRACRHAGAAGGDRRAAGADGRWDGDVVGEV